MSGLWCAAGCLVVALAVCTPSTVFAQDNVRVLAKMGAELDTNARRTVGSQTETDEVLRFFSKSSGRWSLGQLGEADAKFLLGGKVHRRIDDEDALATSLVVGLRRVWELGSVTMGPALRADLADRSERSSSRDYWRGGVVGGATVGWSPVSLFVGVGYRGFVYKPDLASSHEGLTVETSLSALLARGLRGQISWSIVDRAFKADRFVEVGQLIALDAGVHRHDRLHSVRAALSYSANWIASVSYALQVNSSNSVGPGLLRHAWEANWTQPLPGDWLLGAQVRVQRTTYDDPVRVDETLQVDDEDRNQLMVSVRVPVVEPIGVEVRYGLYMQALGEQADFARQLVTVSLVAEVY